MAISPVTLEKISPATAPVPATSQASNSTNNIQTEITNKQQHLKRVSSDTTITATEREQKRRELQKEIDELNRKLQLEKLEQKEEAAEAAKKRKTQELRKAEMLNKLTSKENAKPAETDTRAAEDGKDTNPSSVKDDKPVHQDMSVQNIQQMLSADYLVQKERMQEQVSTKQEGTKNVLEAEIKQDRSYGTDTSRKEAELKAIQQKENFWSDVQKQATSQAQTQTVNANSKIVVDQI